MTLDTAGLRVLSREECLALLGTVPVGRVALSHGALPMILPVHYRLEDDRVVIHTTTGSTLHRATDQAVVAFEAEGPAGEIEPRWSVVVHGVATHVAQIPPSDGPAVRQIEISTAQVTGRELLDGSTPARVPARTGTFASTASDRAGGG